MHDDRAAGCRHRDGGVMFQKAYIITLLYALPYLPYFYVLTSSSTNSPFSVSDHTRMHPLLDRRATVGAVLHPLRADAAHALNSDGRTARRGATSDVAMHTMHVIFGVY